LPAESTDKAPAYVGGALCAPCHGDIAEAWKSSRHAKAIESLKKSKQETLPACVKCHVTGYEQDGGFLDYELTPEMAGVQCEECHGAGSRHVGDPVGEPVQSKAPDVDNCRRCHTEKQDPKFDYKEKATLVHRVG
jgi:hypothetical protein